MSGYWHDKVARFSIRIHFTGNRAPWEMSLDPFELDVLDGVFCTNCEGNFSKPDIVEKLRQAVIARDTEVTWESRCSGVVQREAPEGGTAPHECASFAKFEVKIHYKQE